MSQSTLDVDRLRDPVRLPPQDAAQELHNRLSPIEAFLDRDNRSSHPLDFFLQLHFDGPVNSDRVADAMAKAVRLHPTLTARLTSESGCKLWHWNDGDTDANQLVSKWKGDRDLQGLDLESECGVRCHLDEAADGSRLTFQFHHVATDGLGAVEFLTDFLKLYDGVPVGEIERDARLLNNRYQYGYDWSCFWKFAKAQVRGIDTVYQFLAKTPKPIKKFQPSDSAVAVSGYPNYMVRGLSAVENEGLRLNAVAHGVSMNSWMLACLFRTLNSVRRRQPEHRPSDLLRVTVPCNMRKRGHERMPAGNVFSLAFPAFRSDAIDESLEFVTKGDQQMQVYRRGCDLPNLLLSLRLLSCRRCLLSRFVSGQYCQATTLFTNLGRLFAKLAGGRSAQVQAGEAKLIDVFGIPPLRPLQSISIATFQYAGRQKMGLRFDPDAHTELEATAILEEFVDRLTTMCRLPGV